MAVVAAVVAYAAPGYVRIFRLLCRFREESAIGGLPGADPFSSTKHVPRGVYRAGGKLDRRATHALATRHGKVRAG